MLSPPSQALHPHPYWFYPMNATPFLVPLDRACPTYRRPISPAIALACALAVGVTLGLVVLGVCELIIWLYP